MQTEPNTAIAANLPNVSNIKARLPMPQGIDDMDARKWRILVESIFPSAKTVEAIVMAIDYCRARKLDIFKRPVNIVSMWNKTLKANVETIWPGINEVQVTAARTGQYAGMDLPVWGKDVTRKFKGQIKGYNDEGAWEDRMGEMELTFPESCAVTVYRLIGGQRCPFTEPVYWLEAYARQGKSEIPNAMWAKRVRGQLLKVAKAFSLRAAFPEEGEYVAEEMEGKEIEHGGIVIDQTKDTKPYDVDSSKPATMFKTNALRVQCQRNIEDSIDKAVTVDQLNEIIKLEKSRFDVLRESGDERDQMVVDSIQNKYRAALVRLKAPAHDEDTGEIIDEDDAEKERQHDENVAAGLVEKPGVEAVPAYLRSMSF